MSDDARLKPDDIRRRFDRAAADFDSADFVHATTRDGLLARLAPLVIDAKRVLDLGCATGSAGALLAKRFRGAQVIALDLSNAMLAANRLRGSLFSRRSCVQARAEAMPFADDVFDVVFANQLLPSIENPGAVFAEVARVLRSGGVFAFATLGPDSFAELAAAWRGVDSYAHVRRFPDMHDVGDALVRAGLRDPVLDVDRLVVRYENIEKLWRDLTAVGARNVLRGRNPALGGKRHFERMLAALADRSEEGTLRLELELVYGHCWGGSTAREGGDFRIDATNIGRRTR